MIKVDFCLPRSIRVKLNSGCQYKCKFCHQEGNAKARDISHDELLRAMDVLKKKLGFYRIHFTGGEPTLYEKFAELLRKTKKAGFINALTSNGQFKSELLPLLKKSGLDSINFSLHTLDSKSFLEIQNISLDSKFGIKWAENCINRTSDNIIRAHKTIKTKVNCVVGDDIVSPQRILNYCKKNNVKLRLLNNLGSVAAINNIEKILRRNNAKLSGHEITFVSSSHRLDYKIGSYEFGVKCIRPFFLESMCKDCELRKSNKCLEGFYGIRLENSPLMVRLCLNKSGKPYVQRFKQFLKSDQLKEISQLMINAMKYLKKDTLIGEQKNRYKSKNKF